MALKLTIDIPDDLAAALTARAAATGTTPEAVVVAGLAEMPWVRPEKSAFRRLAGSIVLGDGNVASRIDEIIGDGLVEELRGRSHD
ncbi:MAG: hypothetical protein K2X87_14570 [Gemmataceae bacterium]|nr:hypothetical protein [Gemmataceae bacterium]